MSRGDKQAFPLPGSYAREGMTLREYYAGLAMQGSSAIREWNDHDGIAKWSVEMADALLAALEAKKP